MSRLAPLAIVLVFVVIIAAAVYGEVIVWRECRQTHTWLYCMRTLSK